MREMSNVGGEVSSGVAYLPMTAYIMHPDACTRLDLLIYLGTVSERSLGFPMDANASPSPLLVVSDGLHCFSGFIFYL